VPNLATGTPPYPEHSSGANAVSSVTGILKLYFGGDELAFSMPSGAAGLTVNPRQYQGSTTCSWAYRSAGPVATDD
jgi:hypothetical protein